MKIAISSNKGKFSKPFSDRFGRCDYFVIVDSGTRAWEAKRNPAATSRSGAGAQVVQFLSDNGVQAVISGRFGPNAHSALEAAGIQAYQARNGTPEELIDQFLAGELKQIHAPTGPERHRRGRSR
jgi:predicted Fe-Mo cluster-binding NifX family protein